MVAYMMTQTDKEPTGAAVTFHFAGLKPDAARAIKAGLNDVAYQLGYISRTGPLSGRGSAAALLAAIASGEVTVIRQDSQGTTQEVHRDSATPAA